MPFSGCDRHGGADRGPLDALPPPGNAWWRAFYERPCSGWMPMALTQAVPLSLRKPAVQRSASAAKGSPCCRRFSASHRAVCSAPITQRQRPLVGRGTGGPRASPTTARTGWWATTERLDPGGLRECPSACSCWCVPRPWPHTPTTSPPSAGAAFGATVEERPRSGLDISANSRAAVARWRPAIASSAVAVGRQVLPNPTGYGAGNDLEPPDRAHPFLTFPGVPARCGRCGNQAPRGLAEAEAGLRGGCFQKPPAALSGASGDPAWPSRWTIAGPGEPLRWPPLCKGAGEVDSCGLTAGHWTTPRQPGAGWCR